MSTATTCSAAVASSSKPTRPSSAATTKGRGRQEGGPRHGGARRQRRRPSPAGQVGKFVVLAILKNVHRGSAVNSDAAYTFESLEIYGYVHHPYNTTKGERGGTATIERFWGMLKCGVNGRYTSVSQKAPADLPRRAAHKGVSLG